MKQVTVIKMNQLEIIDFKKKAVYIKTSAGNWTFA